MSIYVLLASFFGTIAFSVLYNIPSKYYLSCGFVGLIGWIVFAFFKPILGYAFAIFLSSAVVAFLSRLLAVRIKCPELIFLIAGIFTLVPGADIYWTVYYLVSGQLSKATTSGSATANACLAMVLGIAIIHEIPQKLFNSLGGAKKKEVKHQQDKGL